MLALDKQFGPYSGLVVFGDHADASLFYYMPEAPRLARRDGKPELSLLKYKRDPTEASGGAGGADLGGGFLAFTVELAVDDGQIAAATSELKKIAPDAPRLEPVQFRAGKAALATLLDQAANDTNARRFVERILGETTPSLYGTERATFALAMPTADDVALVEGMLTHAAISPIGVRYELQYDGLRPAIQARITAKYDRVYHQLKQQFSAGASYYGIGLSVDLGWAAQQLRETGDLVVEVLEFTDDADLRARADEALQWFQNQLVQTFFRPSLTPGGGTSDLTSSILDAAKSMGIATAQGLLANTGATNSIAKQLGISPGTIAALLGSQGAGGSSAGATSNISFKLSYTFLELNETDLKTMNIDYSVAAAETRTAAPQGLLDALSPDDASQSIAEVTLGSRDFRDLRVHVQPTVDFTQQGVDKMTIELEYPAARADGAAPAASAIFEFDAQHVAMQSFAMWVDDAGDLSFRYRVTLAFALDGPWHGVEQTTQTDWVTTMERELVLSPLAYVSFVDLSIGPGLLDWQEVTEVQVDVRCGGEGGVQQTALLTQSAPNAHARFRRPRSGDASIESRPTWFLATGARVAGDWSSVDSTLLLVDGPFRASRVLRLVPMLPPSFVDCSVTLTYQERGYVHTQVVTFTPGDERVQTISFRSFDDPSAPVDLRVYFTRADLSVFDQTTRAVTAPAFVIADRASGSMRSIHVRLLSAGPLAEAKLSAVRVQLLDPDDDTKVLDQLLFTESRRDPLTWFIPVKSADQPLQYRYRVVRYDLFGVATTGAAVSSSDEELLLAAASG